MLSLRKKYRLIYLPCITASFFFSSAALLPYAIDINEKKVIKIKAKLIAFFKRVILYMSLEYRNQAVLCGA